MNRDEELQRLPLMSWDFKQLNTEILGDSLIFFFSNFELSWLNFMWLGDRYFI